jgi:hypothetical protein
MSEACTSDLMEHAATIGLNPPTTPGGFPTTFYATCGCGERVLDSGTQDEADAALTAHRAQSPTSEEGDE